ncbi:MAG: desulfoferrodoxin [Clostridiales bacterium]|jgi:superoxide reductase|nr:desulfoferrodoxin [Clostridiales bacterium]
MSYQKFFICSHCGNIVGLIQEAGVPMICCGEKMEELVPNTVDAAQEKHVPVVTVDGNTVKVEIGSVEHPMVDEHYIQWIYLQTEKGGQRKGLKPGEKPSVTFSLVDDKAIAAFEYCNLHGLWKADIK